MKTTLIVNQDGSLTVVITAQAPRQQQLLGTAGDEIRNGVTPKVTFDEATGELRVEFVK